MGLVLAPAYGVRAPVSLTFVIPVDLHARLLKLAALREKVRQTYEPGDVYEYRRQEKTLLCDLRLRSDELSAFEIFTVRSY